MNAMLQIECAPVGGNLRGTDEVGTSVAKRSGKQPRGKPTKVPAASVALPARESSYAEALLLQRPTIRDRLLTIASQCLRTLQAGTDDHWKVLQTLDSIGDELSALLQSLTNDQDAVQAIRGSRTIVEQAYLLDRFPDEDWTIETRRDLRRVMNALAGTTEYARTFRIQCEIYESCQRFIAENGQEEARRIAASNKPSLLLTATMDKLDPLLNADEHRRLGQSYVAYAEYVRACCEPPPAKGKASNANKALAKLFVAMGVPRSARSFLDTYGNKRRARKKAR